MHKHRLVRKFLPKHIALQQTTCTALDNLLSFPLTVPVPSSTFAGRPSNGNNSKSSQLKSPLLLRRPRRPRHRKIFQAAVFSAVCSSRAIVRAQSSLHRQHKFRNPYIRRRSSTLLCSQRRYLKSIDRYPGSKFQKIVACVPCVRGLGLGKSFQQSFSGQVVGKLSPWAD